MRRRGGIAAAWLLAVALGCFGSGQAAERGGTSPQAPQASGTSPGCLVEPQQIPPPGCPRARRECICDGPYSGCRWAWVGCPRAY